MKDFIIVGRGLAATCLMHSFHENNLSFTVIGKTDLSRCSLVAAGIWNPIVFKRLTKSWKADELIPFLKKFYVSCEKRCNKKFVTIRNIIRPFSEEQEKNLWIKKSKNDLEDFLDPQIKEEGLPDCNINGGYGVVLESGNLNVSEFLNTTAEYFSDRFINEDFNHNLLKIKSDQIEYHGIMAKSIIFCEGHLVKNNPFFKWIPLKPAKGEILTVKLKGFDLGNSILNKGAFLMSVEDQIFKLGATYNWSQLDEVITEGAKAELLAKLAEMVNVQPEVLNQEAGIRPSSIDRRPIVGSHPLYRNLYIFNGLGTKGVMLAPYFVNNFVNFYLQKEPLHPEVNVKRFYNLYEEKK